VRARVHRYRELALALDCPVDGRGDLGADWSLLSASSLNSCTSSP
jgi:hypothetical protein